MSRYLWIVSIQSPFPFSIDENNRVMYSCNYDMVIAAPAGDMEREVLSHLRSATPTALATELLLLPTGYTGDTIIGPSGQPPAGPGPFNSLIDTSGVPPLETHDGAKYERFSLQVITRAGDHDLARERAFAIWRRLDGQRNLTLSA